MTSGQGSMATMPADGRLKDIASTSPEWMAIGSVAPTLEQIVAAVVPRQRHVQSQAKMLPEADQRVFLAQHDFMGFEQYKWAVGAAERRRQHLGKSTDLGEYGSIPAIPAFVGRYQPRLHKPTLEGWVQYLCEVAPPLAGVISALSERSPLPESERRMHTLITAAAGWGKTELLKSLVHHYVVHDTAAVVVLDPHGDMAPQIAKWPELRGSDRLVYVQPELTPGHTVGINPLDARGLDENGIAVFADQLGIAIGELSSDLTGNMDLIARGCARLLLEDGNATFFDLLDLLENPPKRDGAESPGQLNRARLIAKGRQHPDRMMQRFFYGRIEADSLRSAREGMDNRISRLLMLPRFQQMTCGPATLHLETAINARKIIVCNLAPLGSAGAAAMGRLIVALVAAIGLRREGTPIAGRVPCHLFVDEAQTMASPSMARILFECRKFGIHLTLAQQAEGVGFDEVGQVAISKSIGTKFVGANLPAALKGVFEGRAITEEEPLKPQQFWMRWGQRGEPTRIKIRSDLADDTHAISGAAWDDVKAVQIRRYYRDAKALMPGAPLTPAEHSGAAPRERRPKL